MEALIIAVENTTDVTILLSDGGVATVHDNGEGMVTDLYQSRITCIPEEGQDFFDEVSEGTMYCNDWAGESVATDTMIGEAIEWLSPHNADPKQIRVQAVSYDHVYLLMYSFLMKHKVIKNKMQNSNTRYAVVNSKGEYVPHDWFEHPNNFFPKSYVTDINDAKFFEHQENAVKFAQVFTENESVQNPKSTEVWNVQPVNWN